SQTFGNARLTITKQPVSFSATSSNPSVAASVQNDLLVLSAAGGFSGTVQVTVTATDGVGPYVPVGRTATQTFDVLVPAVIGNRGPLTLLGGASGQGILPSPYPVVAGNAAGNFVAIWRETPALGPLSGLEGIRLDAHGTPIGSPFQIAANSGDADVA